MRPEVALRGGAVAGLVIVTTEGRTAGVASERPARPERRTTDARRKDPAKKRLLVVEDDEEIRAALVTIFQLYLPDVQVEAAHDGVQGLAACQAALPDMIITDCRMPAMDGLEMLERLGARREQVPVIMVTAYVDETTRQAAQRLGVRMFIAKPFEIDELLANVEIVLGES